jgi:hypothetical protein
VLLDLGNTISSSSSLSSSSSSNAFLFLGILFLGPPGNLKKYKEVAVDVWSVAVNIIVDAVVRSAVKVVAVDRSEVVAVAAALVVVSYLKFFCPLPCLWLYFWS